MLTNSKYQFSHLSERAGEMVVFFRYFEILKAILVSYFRFFIKKFILNNLYYNFIEKSRIFFLETRFVT